MEKGAENEPTKPANDIRIALIPVIILVYIFPYSQFGIEPKTFLFGAVSLSVVNLIVLGIYLVAAFTDFLDGNIARKRNMITTFGKFADPIADKLLTTTLFILFASRGIIPVIPVIIMICRDTIVDGCRMIAATNGVVVAAGYLGKFKTVTQMVSIALILLNNLPFELWGCRFPKSCCGLRLSSAWPAASSISTR
jgi:CDP-diacylglycerol--glycerol-3-phosphate 3-phosphatidyltransferase